MNMCEVWSTITVKSVIAGEYTAPPAHGPTIRLICGITPEAWTLRRKISAEQAERDDAFLDARAAAVVDADDRAAGLQREVHDLDDLLAVDLAERAAEDREVLARTRYRAAVDRAVAGDDAVAVGAVLLQAEVGRAVPGELVQLDEGALVEQQFDPLTGGQLALGVLLLDRACGAGVRRLVDAALQVRELARGGVDV